jgi:hypothetical protein
MTATDLLIHRPDVGFPLFIEEEIPMTMQIGLRALSGNLVLAGDTKCRVQEATSNNMPERVPSGILSHSKIAICEPHQLAVAVSGVGELGTSPEELLAKYLGEQKSIPEDELRDILVEWGKQYFQEHKGPFEWTVQMHSFLIVNPRDQYPFWKLRVGPKCSSDRSDRYMVNGHENNTAIFWPEYFRCDAEMRGLAATTKIAALTIGMGAELNPYGVSGLEIWQFNKKWNRLLPAEVEAITAHLQTFKNFIHQSILE